MAGFGIRSAGALSLAMHAGVALLLMLAMTPGGHPRDGPGAPVPIDLVLLPGAGSGPPPIEEPTLEPAAEADVPMPLAERMAEAPAEAREGPPSPAPPGELASEQAAPAGPAGVVPPPDLVAAPLPPVERLAEPIAVADLPDPVAPAAEPPPVASLPPAPVTASPPTAPAPTRARPAASRPPGRAAAASSGADASPAAMPATPVVAPQAALPVVTNARYRHPPAPPIYPPPAIAMGITGTVVLRALVGRDGTTRELRVWRSSGHPQLDRAATDAARTWAFVPATVAGQVIEAWVEVPVHFRLQ